jgi:hypothetical protein
MYPLGTWKPKPSAISVMPIINRKPSASITIVGFFSMKFASGVAATSITVIATITAMIAPPSVTR